MRAVIKSGSADAAEPFRAIKRPLGTVAREAPDPRDIELTALRSALERAERALAETQEAQIHALETAHEEGRKKGRAEAQDREADRLKRLDQGLTEACTAWGERVDRIDVLAPQLARAAIARLFDGVDDRAELVTAMIARRLADLRRDSVLALRVSALDFHDKPALAALAATLSNSQVEITTDPTLDAGRARFELKLGALDLDLAEQWHKVAALLEAMESGAP